MNNFQAVLYGEMHGDYIATDYKIFDTDALAEKYITSKLGSISNGLLVVLGKLYRQGFQDGEIAWVSDGEYEF